MRKEGESFSVLVLSGPEGHASIGDAVGEVVESMGGQVREVDWISGVWFMELYKMIYRYAPGLFWLVFRLADWPGVRNVIEFAGKRWLGDRLKEWLEQEDPDVVVTTYWGYLPPLEIIKDQFKWVNVVPDPRGIHRITVSGGADVNVVFDEVAARVVEGYGVDPDRIRMTGWLVRQEFLGEFDKNQVRHELGFEKGLRTIFVCAGSEGSHKVKALINFLIEKQEKMQLIFVAGSNQKLKEWVEEKLKDAVNIRSRVFGFVGAEQMARLMSVSDVAFIKGGPNLIFEAVAQDLPVVIIAHISGQEDGNLELVKEYGLGWVMEEVEDWQTGWEEVMAGLDQVVRSEGFRQVQDRMKSGREKLREVLTELVEFNRGQRG